MIGIILKYYSIIKCFFGRHDYKYSVEKIKGISLFGEVYEHFNIRRCENCKSKQIEIRYKEWEDINY